MKQTESPRRGKRMAKNPESGWFCWSGLDGLDRGAQTEAKGLMVEGG
jgi:hypothetical protein